MGNQSALSIKCGGTYNGTPAGMEGIVVGIFSFMSMFGCIYNRKVQRSMFMLDSLNISHLNVSFLDGRIWLKCAFATIVMTKVLELYLSILGPNLSRFPISSRHYGNNSRDKTD